jgi:hypothetical protein
MSCGNALMIGSHRTFMRAAGIAVSLSEFSGADYQNCVAFYRLLSSSPLKIDASPSR